MAIVCRCFRVQRAIAHRLAVDSLSSNSRNDGMQKGMPGISQTSEKNIGRNIDGKIAEFILVATTHPASSSIITNAIKFLNCSFECVERSHARDHPVVPQLNSLFGEHTFFLDSHGLNIVEPAEASGAGVQSAKVVNLANWSDADPKRLEPHEPEPTNVVVIVGSRH